MKLCRHSANGYLTAYRVTIGSKEARDAGFLTEDGQSRELVKIVDTENHQVIFKLAEDMKAE